LINIKKALTNTNESFIPTNSSKKPFGV